MGSVSALTSSKSNPATVPRPMASPIAAIRFTARHWCGWRTSSSVITPPSVRSSWSPKRAASACGARRSTPRTSSIASASDCSHKIGPMPRTRRPKISHAGVRIGLPIANIAATLNNSMTQAHGHPHAERVALALTRLDASMLKAGEHLVAAHRPDRRGQALSLCDTSSVLPPALHSPERFALARAAVRQTRRGACHFGAVITVCRFHSH
jgi:hypothetical protein